MNPPDNLPPLPPVPPGFDRWEYHPPGSGWKSDTPRVWGAILTGMTEWQLNDGPETACGTNSLHYIEAVIEPAEAPPTGVEARVCEDIAARQRDAYAETLREFLAIDPCADNSDAINAIRERHPELAENV